MKQCTRCIYDDLTPGISFDENGVCSYCKIHDEMNFEYPTGEKGDKILKQMGEKIKKSSRKSEFDCVIGVSGGCDSSYLLDIAKNKMGLNPVAAHFDNTWNTKTAVENIRIVLKELDIELYTYVMDNEEFNDMGKAMLLASVPEVDGLTDMALTTTLYMAAEKYKVKYILNGHSFRTEGITPIDWIYFDGKYIDNIYRQFGNGQMDRYPNLWLSKWMKYLFKRIKRVRPLYYIDYNKEDTKHYLNEKYGWQWYGGHHLENRFCAYNHYLLKEKFNMDLRVVEYSALVRSSQMNRDDALRKINEPQAYPDELVGEIKKRLQLSDDEYDRIMALPPKTNRDYKTYRPTFHKMKPFFYLMYKADLIPKSFYIKYCKK